MHGGGGVVPLAEVAVQGAVKLRDVKLSLTTELK